MRGIILAGGHGTRLAPLTRVLSKQLMPVYDKPMIYYPLSTLMLAGIRNVLIITTPQDCQAFSQLLGDGSALGMRISYAVQQHPDGLAHALVLGREFVGDESVALVLGDNILHFAGLGAALAKMTRVEGAHIFAYRVARPQAYGVVELAPDGRVLSIEEKPERPRSDYAVLGLYFYDNSVLDVAASIAPSARGEYEITTVNEIFLGRGLLNVSVLGRGAAWLDTGTFDDLVAATEFVRVVESRQGYKIGCIEEVAWRMGWIDDEQLMRLAEPLRKSGYGDYLGALPNPGSVDMRTLEPMPTPSHRRQG